MEQSDNESSPTGYFASACGRMNDFAQSLRQSSVFVSVRTGANIRHYESGWRLEKWVEAELDRTEGLWAAWWLELGPRGNGWFIESNLAISPDILFLGLEDRIAATPDDVRRQLSLAIEELTYALQRNQRFSSVPRHSP